MQYVKTKLYIFIKNDLLCCNLIFEVSFSESLLREINRVFLVLKTTAS